MNLHIFQTIKININIKKTVPRWKKPIKNETFSQINDPNFSYMHVIACDKRESPNKTWNPDIP